MISHGNRWHCDFLTLALTASLGSAAVAEQDFGAHTAWSEGGRFCGVVVDQSRNAIFALDRHGRCLELDSTGTTKRELRLSENRRLRLRFANWPDDGGNGLLTFDVWATELRTYDLEGKQLWTYHRGIDDVWTADLDGDGSDEVIVGYNGSNGLHVLDNRGKLVWKCTQIGNVWNVCAGNVWGQETLQVVATSAAGKVHIFSGDGKQRRDLEAGYPAYQVRVAEQSEADSSAAILVGGQSGKNRETAVLSSLSSNGAKRWSLELPSASAAWIDSAIMAAGKPWLAVGMREGLVHVVDVNAPEIIASVSGQGHFPEVGWLGGENVAAPLLLVATGYALNAFYVRTAKLDVDFPSRDGYAMKIRVEVSWTPSKKQDRHYSQLVAGIAGHVRDFGSRRNVAEMTGKQNHARFVAELRDDLVRQMKMRGIQIDECRLLVGVCYVGDDLRERLKPQVANEVILYPDRGR